MLKNNIKYFSTSLANLKGPRNYVNRKTGRGCGNAVLPRFEWRYDKAIGKNFQRLTGIKYGIDMGLQDRLLIISMSNKTRRLDDKKMQQLSKIMQEKIGEVMATDELLAQLAIQITTVKVDRSFSQVTVGWMCRGEGDDTITKILNDGRHEMRKRVGELMGVTCPEIIFSGDKTLVIAAQMDKLFKEADYGVDYRSLSKSARVLGNVDDRNKENQSETNKPEKVPAWLKLIRAKKQKEAELNMSNDNNC